MDLDLETVRVRGRARRPVAAVVVRPLRKADIALLASERDAKPNPIAKIRERHHALARCLADGMSETEAGIATGYSASRISILKGDPAFSELVKFYRDSAAERYLGMHDMLAAVGMDATAEILDRLEDDPNQFKVRELIELASFGADRTGHGPTSKQEVSHTVNFGARLEAARRRMIDITPERGAVHKISEERIEDGSEG